MSRTKRTTINIVVGLTQLTITSALSLYVNRLVLLTLGSDYNGVNATISQTITMLSLLEGGFTTASIVALYKPYVRDELSLVNRILSTSKKAFNRIGIYAFAIGTVISITYPVTMKSNLSYSELALVFFLSVVPLSFNLTVVLKYRLIFQAAQKEYTITLIQLVGTVITQILTIITLKTYPNILLVRSIHAILNVAVGFAIRFAAIKTFRFLDFTRPADYSLIRGTKDVFVGNITSFIYSSTTVLFLSTFVSTTATSVYAVYNSILVIVANVINVVLSSPQNAFGQVIAEENPDKTNSVLVMFEFITIVSVCILFSVTYSLIIQFVSVYTANVFDANYLDIPLATILIITAALQAIHYPSGLCISLHSRFKAVRNIQLVAGTLIIILSIPGALLWGLYGLVGAKLITTLFLLVVEVWYARRRILKRSAMIFLKMLLPNAVVAAVLACFLQSISQEAIRSLSTFFIYAIINSVAITLVMVLLNLLLYPRHVKELASILGIRRLFGTDA